MLIMGQGTDNYILVIFQVIWITEFSSNETNTDIYVYKYTQSETQQ